MKKLLIIISLLSLFVISSYSFCSAKPLPVFVSIVPQKYFVEQIAGDLVDIKVMVMPGASPENYEPKPSQMAALSKASIYFAIGVPFEDTWMRRIKAANPKIKIISTDDNVPKKDMEPANLNRQKKSNHGHNDGHQHTGMDPHIWLSPKLVKIQALNIYNALKKVDPANIKNYEQNFQLFIQNIDQLDKELEKIFFKKANMRFMVFHPSWGYFADSYRLKQVPIEIEGKTPKPAQLKKLIKHAREHKINVIFVQPQYSAKSARLIAKEINGNIIFADPLAEEWLVNLREIAFKFKESLK